MLAMLALCWSQHAAAQLLDDIESARSDDGAAVTVHFAAQVSYRRHVISPAGDEVQVYFAVTAAGDTVSSSDDVRDLPPGAGLPRLMVRLPARAQGNSLRRLDLRFDSPVDFVRVGPGPDNRTLVVVAHGRLPIEAAPVASPVVSASAADVHGMPTDPAALLQAAVKAMGDGEHERAVALLNRLLDQPPNVASEEAQAIVGDARAALGEYDRARAEYTLYLRLYPDSPRAQQVRARLDALGNRVDNRLATRGGGDAGEDAGDTSYWGSVSQYYYGGQSQIRNETTIVTPATDAREIDVQNISSNDQSSLVTNVDANARYRGNGWDNRFVVRDVHLLSLIDAQPTRNRLSALYADVRNEDMGFDARVGRQSSTSGGVLGRFDGAVLHYRVAGDWKIGVLGGVPVDSGIGKSKVFYGATLDNDHLLPGFGLGVFAFEQRTEGFVDRRAVGMELRYFDEHANAFSLFDYDLRYRRINVGSLQGTLMFDGGATLNLLYDYRRSPMLQLSNALLGANVQSLERLRELQGEGTLRDDALGLTPVSKVLLLSGTYPVSEHWQVGGEVRVSSIGGTRATSSMPASDGSGDVRAYTVQAIGTGLAGSSGVLVMSASRLASDLSEAWLASMTTRLRPNDHWSIEPALRYYVQDASNDTRLERLAPTLRVSYQLGETMSLESEISYERSHTQGNLVDEQSNVVFYYVGYHWDF